MTNIFDVDYWTSNIGLPLVSLIAIGLTEIYRTKEKKHFFMLIVFFQEFFPFIRVFCEFPQKLTNCWLAWLPFVSDISGIWHLASSGIQRPCCILLVSSSVADSGGLDAVDIYAVVIPDVQ